jgi:hypothetical protein
MVGTPHASVSTAALKRDALTVWPGMTIYGVGDLAHQGQVSGHNPDDYPPLQAELTDGDTDPEWRALDFMLGAKFSREQGRRLVAALTSGVDRGRLYYVIFEGRIYRRANDFRSEAFGGDSHTSHVHVSTHVSDDSNGAAWRSVLALKESAMCDINQLHALLFAIHTADTPAERQVRDMIMGGAQLPAGVAGGLLTPLRNAVTELDANVAALALEVAAARAALEAIGTANPDVAAILAGFDERLAALQSDVEADTRDAVADGLEGGAAAVREDAPDA